MQKSPALLRYGAIAFGVAVLTSAGTAVASAASIDDDAVDVHVTIAPPVDDGFLALSVEESSTLLEEVDSDDPLVRQFDGSLPTVTVTDTRTTLPEAGSYWAVLGTASDFVNDEDDAVTIGAEYLGWVPALLADYGSEIDAGQPVDGAVDDGPGLATQDTEILYVNWDQEENFGQGPWSATADLSLKVPAASVEPGSYTSVLTLSLFE